jgi:Nif-specific regulatory protein
VGSFVNDCQFGCGSAGPDAEAGGCGRAVAHGCRVVDELNLLLDISYTLESSLELREVIRPVLQKMEEVMDLRCGTITILHRNENHISISEAVGLPRHVTKEDYLRACRPLIDEVLRTGQAIVVPDLANEPQFKGRAIEGEGEAVAHAFLGVPVKFGEEVVGCLSVERPSDGQVSLAADRRLVSLVANVIAQAVHLHRLAEERLHAWMRLGTSRQPRR